ncbi:MAG: linear amide C-N hydrolase [Bacteroidales bacterium]|nr:linear amide C-N hydrolase [Bacteroidales bacterium]
MNIKKNTNSLFANFLFLSLFSILITPSYGCTAFMLKTSQGVVTGRTLDYSQPSVYNTKIYKIGTIIQSLHKAVPPQYQFSWEVKHEFITVNNVLPDPENYLVAFEGMNKAGISISGNLASADYPKNDPDKPTLSSDDIVSYILSLASDMNDVKMLFSSINIESHWKYHYILFDSSANSLVVEFINGEAKFYENATQILTNNPSLDYQLSNLNNFANLKNYNFESISPISGNEFHGAGMYGLPGDWMSPGRFIRGYFMIEEGQNYISNTEEAINLASKIINSVSLIKGIDLGKSEISDPIYTQLQIIKDIKNNKIYLKRYVDFEWTVVSY